MTADAAIWAIIPAAGSGTRMRAALPKQYLPLHGRPVILHAIERLATHPYIRGVKVGIAADDTHWPAVRGECAQLSRFLGTYSGGDRRAHTVLNGLDAFAGTAAETDWALVHDAVRPCLRHADVDALIDAVRGSDGGLLALPVTDTVKLVNAGGRVEQTIERSGLWRALTPQMFRFGALRRALRAALAHGADITDEAAAMELAGTRPRVVAGHADNIKITLPSDIALAEFILSAQERGP